MEDMVSSQGTSFIPARPTKGKVKAGSIRKIYLLSYLSYILFFCTIMAAGGIFIYKVSLSNQLEQQQDLLAQERQSFNQSDLVRIQDLDFRIDTAMERLNQHVSVVSILTALEQSTVESVYFLDFNYSRLAGGLPEVVLSAKANGFDALLFQKDIFDSNPILQGASLSSVSMQIETSDEDPVVVQEVVSFTLAAAFDPALILYKTKNSVFSEEDDFLITPDFTESDTAFEEFTEGAIDNSESL